MQRASGAASRRTHLASRRVDIARVKTVLNEKNNKVRQQMSAEEKHRDQARERREGPRQVVSDKMDKSITVWSSAR